MERSKNPVKRLKQELIKEQSSTVIRWPATQDVRLTSSDKVHQLILERAEAERRRIKQEKMAKRLLKKRDENQDEEMTQLTGLGRVASPTSVTSSKYQIVPPPSPRLSSEIIIAKLAPKDTLILEREKTIKGGGANMAHFRKTKVAPKGKRRKTQLLKRAQSPGRPVKRVDAKATAAGKPKDIPRQVTEDFVLEVAKADSGQDLIEAKSSQEPSLESSINSIWIEELQKRYQEATKGTEQESQIISFVKDKKGNIIKINDRDVQKQLAVIRKKLEGSGAVGVYNPYAHRHNPHGVSNCEAIALVIRSILASGVLKMPMIFAFVGAYNGVWGVALVILWISFSLHVYIHARQTMCQMARTPYLSFSDTVRQAILLGPKSTSKLSNYCGYAVDIALIYFQIINLIKYSIFIALYSGLVFNGPRAKIHAAMYLMPFLVICLVGMYIKSLRKLAVISIFANFIACVTFLIILFQLTGNLTGRQDSQTLKSSEYPVISFIGQTLSSANCLATVLVVESRMKHPKVIIGYSGMANLALMFTGLWYIMMGFFGVYQFGNTVNYTYLVDLDYSEKAYISLYVMYLFVMTISFCVHAYPAITLLWDFCLKCSEVRNSEHINLWSHLLRTTFAVMPFFLICCHKTIFHVIMLAGYSLGPFLLLTVPIVIHLCVSWNGRKLLLNKILIAGDLVFLLFSLFGVLCVTLWYIQAIFYNVKFL